MTVELGSLIVRLDVLDKDAVNSIDSFSDKMKNIGTQLSKTGAIMTATISAPIALLGKQMFGMAADFNESLNKVDVSFGDTSDEVKAFAQTTLKSFGIAEGTALDMASLFGDMGTSMGLTTKDASKMSTGMVGLAGDLASFKNVQLDVAKTALAGIFTGETESLKKLGIVMTEANLKQYALSKGYTTAYENMSQAEKVQLRYAYVTDMSSNAVGDFARTSDSSSNATRTLNETIKEASTQFGQALLPILTPIIVKLTELAKWFGSLNDNTKTVIVSVGLFLVAVGPVVTIIGAITTAFGMLSAAMAFILSPIGLVVAAIAALIAIGVLLWKNWDTITEAANNVFVSVKTSFENMLNAIKETFTNIYNSVKDFIDIKLIQPFKNINLFQIGKDIIDGLWNGIKNKWNDLTSWASTVASGLTDTFKKVFGIASPSKVFTELGANITQGLVNGLQSVDIKVGASIMNAPSGAPTIAPQGTQQTIIINAPTTLNPATVAKEVTKASRALAIGLY